MTEPSLFTTTRRDLVVGGVSVGIAGAMPGARAQAASLRPDIHSTAGRKMIALYATAVKAMQDPEINYPPQPKSWQFQAYIHGVPANPFDPANSGGLWNGSPGLTKRIDAIYGSPAAGSPQAAWKEAASRCWATCTHGSSYFTTWHRWYMYYFERICRSMCNDVSFMLPYWNYGSALGPTLQLPQAFRDQDTPLLFDDRGLGFADPQGSGQQNVAMNLGGYMPFPLIDYGPALSADVMFPSDDNFAQPPQPAYYAFGLTGRLECVPHDMVHSSVGGWMGNVPSAAGDPVFFVHHCQVDRLYASWEAVPGVSYNWGDSPTQPSEPTWKDRQAFFVDERGALVQKKLGDAIDIATLGYGYDTLAKPPPVAVAALAQARIERAGTAAGPIVMAAMQAKGFSVGSGGATVTLAPAEASEVAAASALKPAAAAPTTLVLAGLKLLRRPPAPLSVFLNLPKGVEPQLNGPYYVGTLNLFNFDLGTGLPMRHGDEHHDHAATPAGAEARFEVARLLADQRVRGLWDGGAITVTVTTLGPKGPGDITYVSFESATLVP